MDEVGEVGNYAPYLGLIFWDDLLSVQLVVQSFRILDQVLPVVIEEVK